MLLTVRNDLRIEREKRNVSPFYEVRIPYDAEILCNVQGVSAYVHGETSRILEEQRSTVKHVRCFSCGRYLRCCFLTPYVPLPAPGSANGPECLTVIVALKDQGCFAVLDLPGGMVEFGVL